MKKRIYLVLGLSLLLLCNSGCQHNSDSEEIISDSDQAEETEQVDDQNESDTESVEDMDTTKSSHVPDSPLSVYLNDVLVPIYGYKDVSHNMTVTDEDSVYDSDYGPWTDAYGIMSAQIADMDGDGSDELFVVRMGNGNYLVGDYFEPEEHPIYIGIYEEEEDGVVCASEIAVNPASDYEVTSFADNQTWENALYVSLIKDEHPVIFTEYSSNGVFADGEYQCYIAYAYDGEKIIKTVEVSQDGEGSDELVFYGHKYEDGEEVSEDLISDGYSDEDEFGQKISDYLSPYNINVDASKMDCYNCAYEESVLLNRSESSDKDMPVMDYSVIATEDSPHKFNAVLKDYTDVRTSFPTTIPVDDETYIKYCESDYNGIPKYGPNMTYVQGGEEEETIINTNNMEINLGYGVSEIIANKKNAFYLVKSDILDDSGYNTNYTLYERELKQGSSSEEVLSDSGLDPALIGVYNNRLYFYGFDPNDCYSADIYYYDLSTGEKTDTGVHAGYDTGHIHDHYLYYEDNYEEEPVAASCYVYDLDTNQTSKLCDVIFRTSSSGNYKVPYIDDVYSTSDHIYYAECDSAYASNFFDYGLLDGYENSTLADIVEASPNGENKNVLAKNIEIRTILKQTDKAVLYVNSAGDEVLLTY